MAGTLPRNRGNRSSNRVGATASRLLRAEGWNISPNARKHTAVGMFVSGNGNDVTVLVDFGLEGKNARTAAKVAETVRAWDNATDVEVEPLEDGSVFVYFTLA